MISGAGGDSRENDRTPAARNPNGLSPGLAGDAEAFTRRAIAATDTARTTGDIDELARLTSRTCAYCHQFVGSMEDLYAKGGRHEGCTWVDPRVRATGWTQVGSVRVRVTGDVEPGAAYEPGKRPQTFEGESVATRTMSCGRSTAPGWWWVGPGRACGQLVRCRTISSASPWRLMSWRARGL